MMIVTGGAGFIGSNLIRALNEQGVSNILVVDNLKNADKVSNLSDLKIADYMDKQAFYDCMIAEKNMAKISAVFHQGACSDTMATDGKYVLHNNFTYSKELFHFCLRHNAQFIYASSASVYGSGKVFIEEPEHESTLNAYAWSKMLFDDYIRRQSNVSIQWVGLRYFNVYGPRESHKGRMASVTWHFYHQYRENNSVRLFQGTDGYEDGEQLRDFICVDDVVKVNLFLLNNPEISGIFNVGTGESQSFNEVALAVINCCREIDGREPLSLTDAISIGEITYIPMPEALIGKYQSYTQADLSKLRSTGYAHSFDAIEQGVKKSISVLDRRNLKR